MPEQRVFSEQEVAQILRRAVELTEDEVAKGYKPGITEDELERIAGEVGVDPAALRRAILEAGEHKHIKGPLSLTEEFERVVEGELDPSQFDVIAEGIKPLSNAGQPHMTQVGRTLQLSAWTGVSQARVTVTSRNGRTKLHVKSNALFQGLMTLHPAFIASLITVASLSERGMGWLGAAIGIGVMTIGLTLFKKLTGIGHRKAEKMADDLRERIAETLAHQPTTVSSEPEQVQTVQQRLGPG